MEEKIKKLEVPEVCVKQEVMKRINDQKIKIKHPAVLLVQRTSGHCVKIILLAAVVAVGIFFARWVVGEVLGK